jgi:hypothetical protein
LKHESTPLIAIRDQVEVRRHQRKRGILQHVSPYAVSIIENVDLKYENVWPEMTGMLLASGNIVTM